MAQPPKKILRINLESLNAIGREEFDRAVAALNQQITQVGQTASNALNVANNAKNGVDAINKNLVDNYLKNTATVNGKSFKANNNAIVLNAKDLGTAPLRYTTARKIYTGTPANGAYSGPNAVNPTVLPESILGRTIMMRGKDIKVRYNDTRQTWVTAVIPPVDGMVHLTGGAHLTGDKVTGQAAYLIISNSGKGIIQVIEGADYSDNYVLRDLYILE